VKLAPHATRGRKKVSKWEESEDVEQLRSRQGFNQGKQEPPLKVDDAHPIAAIECMETLQYPQACNAPDIFGSP
jgi:hypothetical protein